MEDEIQGKIRKRGVSSPSSSSLARRNRFKRAILLGKRVGSRTPVTTPKMTMARYPVSEVATECTKYPTSERDGVVSARRLAATLWGMNEASVTSSEKGSSCRKVYCSDRADLDSLPDTETQTTSRQQFKDVCKGLSTAKELLKALTYILRLEEKHSSSANSLILALRFELDRARAQVDQLAYADRLHGREMKCVMQHLEMERDKVRRAAEVVASELEAERKLRKQAERMNRKLGRELADGKARLEKAVKELEMEKRTEDVLELVLHDRPAVEEPKREETEACVDVEKVRQIVHLAEPKYHFEKKKADFGKLKAELEAYMSDNVVTEDTTAADHVDEADELEALRTFLRKTLGKACQNPNIEPEEESHGDGDHDSRESDTHSIELVLDGSDKSYKWANSPLIVHDDSKRPSFEVFKGRKSLSEKIQWASISLLKGSSTSKDDSTTAPQPQRDHI